MQSSVYSDFRSEFIGKLVEPVDTYLSTKGITPMIVPLFILLIMLFFVLHKRPKEKKFNIYEKNVIFGSIAMFILTLLSQIIMITKPWER